MARNLNAGAEALAMKGRTKGYAVLAAAVIASGAMPLAYSIGNNTNPVQLAFLAALVGTLGSAALMVAKGTHTKLPDHVRKPRSLFQFAFVGATYAVLMLIFAYTTHFISAALLSVVYRSWPLILLLIAPVMLKERMSRYGLAAVAIGFAGMAVALLGGTAVSLPLSSLPYAALVLVGAGMDAVAGAFQRGYKYEITSSLFLYNLFTLAVLAAVVPLSGVNVLAGIGTGDIAVVLILGLVQNVVMTLMFTNVIRTVKVELTANAMIAVPFITIVLGYLALRQAIEPAYLLIAACVTAGLVLQKLEPKQDADAYISKNTEGSGGPVLFDVTTALAGVSSGAVYDYIKANGRAAALCMRARDPATLEAYLDAVRRFNANSQEFMLMTNRDEEAKDYAEEFGMVKDAVGHGDDDLVVLGIGAPEAIAENMGALHSAMVRSAGPSTPPTGPRS